MVRGMKHYALILLVLAAGCDRVQSTSDRLFGGSSDKANEAEATEQAATPEEGEATEVGAEVEGEAEVVQAAAIAPGWTGARQTVAGLGDPTVGGRWMETPLVSQERNGRVVVRKTGASANITLIPVPGDPGSGSRLSLDAMRALLAPIDELVELDVYSN